MRLTLYTESGWIELGIQAVMQWDGVVMCGEDYRSLQIITPEMIARVVQMETVVWGFTPEFQAKMIAELEKNIGKHLLITDHFSKEEGYMEIVQSLNEGKTLAEAIAAAKGLVKTPSSE